MNIYTLSTVVVFNQNNNKIMEKIKNNGLDSEKSSFKDTCTKDNQIKKLSKGTVFNTTSKIIILNVYKYFRTKGYDVNVSEAVRLTVEATGCSPTSVYQLRKEENSKEGLREPSKKRIRKGVHKLSRDLKYDDTVRMTIKNIVQELNSKDAISSLTAIMEHIKNTNGMGNKQLQSMAPWTLRRLIFDLGFVYKKDGNKKYLVNKEKERKVKKQIVRKKHLTPENTPRHSMEHTLPDQDSPNLNNTTIYTASQFVDQYILYEPLKTHNVLAQPHEQIRIPQDDTQMCNILETLSNNFLVEIPPSITSPNIHHPVIGLFSSTNQ